MILSFSSFSITLIYVRNVFIIYSYFAINEQKFSHKHAIFYNFYFIKWLKLSFGIFSMLAAKEQAFYRFKMEYFLHFDKYSS